VVWHGVRPLDQAPPTDAQRENLVLHVGAIQKRKNLPLLIDAFERLDAGWRLVLAGSQGYGAEQTMERIARSPARERIELTGWVDDQQLEQLYRRARIFAFPSLDEGFGIPVLEAMARGIPVVTSDRGALREVAGTAAVVVDVSGDAEQLALALRRLAMDAGERRLLREQGLAHASRHSWQAAAAQTWEVYQELR
jgi:glycosyltransferase involved in cell wall biosynthesis